MLNQSTFFIPKNIRNHLAVMNRYVAFAGGNEKIYKTITPKDLDFSQIIKTCLFSSMEKILKELDRGTRADDDVKCALCLVYLGLTLRDAILLKQDQVITEKKEIYDQFRRTIVCCGDDCAWDEIQRYKIKYNGNIYFLQPNNNILDENDPLYLTQSIRYYGKRITIAKTKSGCEKLKSVNVWYSGALHRLLIADQLKMLTNPSAAKRTIQMCFPGIQMTTSDIMLMYNGYKAMIEEE